MIFGTIGPLLGRRGDPHRLPFEFSAIGVAPGRAQRVCEYAKHEVLQLAQMACQLQSDLPFQGTYPGAQLVANERERRAFLQDGWNRYAYRPHPHVVVLADITVMAKADLASALAAHFDVTHVPVWWELRGFGCRGQFSVLTSTATGAGQREASLARAGQ